jgi:hypothetical protein
MAYEISWLVPNHIVEVTFPSICDDEFVRRSDHDLRTILETAPGSVHILADMSAVSVYPSTQCVLRFKSFKHPRMGRFITIEGANTPIKRFLCGLATRAAGVRTQDFFTVDEARSYIVSVERIMIEA